MNPWPSGAIRCLKGADFIVALQCQCDLVETLQQPLAPPRIDLEGVVLSGRRENRLRLKIDTDPSCPLCCLDVGRQRIDDFLVDNDGENSILKAVGEEDIAETRTDNGADAHLLQRPDRAFTGRATAEIRPGHEDLGLPVWLAIQNERRVLR